ncbi:hypothetical protein D1872_51410 [compost metagenome]
MYEISTYRVAVQGLDDTSALVYEVSHLCREGYCFVAYAGEDDRFPHDPITGEDEGIGYYAIMHQVNHELTCDQANDILNHYYPLEEGNANGN